MKKASQIFILLLFFQNLFCQKQIDEIYSKVTSRATFSSVLDCNDLTFNDCVASYFEQNFNQDLLEKHSLNSLTIFIEFIIDKNGKITNSLIHQREDYFINEELKKEALRVINSLPVATPNYYGDLPVNARFGQYFYILSESYKLEKAKELATPSYELEITDSECLNKALDNDEVFNIVEVMPFYGKCDGSSNDRMQCSNEHLKIAIEEKVKALNLVLESPIAIYVKFVIDETGAVTQTTLAKPSDNELLNEQALSIVRELTDWTCGKQRGVPVKVQYITKVTFK